MEKQPISGRDQPAKSRAPTGSGGAGKKSTTPPGGAKSSPPGAKPTSKSTSKSPSKSPAERSGAGQPGKGSPSAQPSGARRTATKGRLPGQAAAAGKTAAPPTGQGNQARRSVQRQSTGRRVRSPATFTGRAGQAVAIGAFVLTIVDIPKLQYSVFAPEAAVFLAMGAAGLPLLVARAVGHRGSRRATSELWAARLAIAFVVSGLISVAMAARPTLALVGLYQHGTGWLFIAGVAGFWALGTGLGDTERRLLELALIFGALANSVLTVFQQLFGLGGIGLEGLAGQPDGVLGNPVLYGGLAAAALVLITPRFIAQPRRWWAGVVIIGVGIGLSGERLPALLALIVVGFYAGSRWRQRSQSIDQLGWRRSLENAGITIAAILVGSLVAKLKGGLGVVSHAAGSTTSETFGQRLDAWRNGLHAFASHPIFGSGPGQFRAATSPYYSVSDFRVDGGVTITFPDAHNIIIEYAVTTGIIGLGLLAAWFVYAVLHRSGPLIGFGLVILALQMAEPLNIVLTPLAFLAIGAAALTSRANPDSPDETGTRASPAARVPAWIGPTSLALAVVAGVVGILIVVGDVNFETTRADNIANNNQAALGPGATANSLIGFWPDTASLLGTIHLALGKSGQPGQYTQAILWAQQAVDKDPTNSHLLTTLARYQGSVGDNAGATRSALEALKYEMTDPDAESVLGILDTIGHEPEAAKKYLEESLNLVPDQTSLRKVLAALNRGCTALPVTPSHPNLRFHCPPS